MGPHAAEIFYAVEPCVRDPPRHGRDGESRNEVGPLTGGAYGPNHLCLPHPIPQRLESFMLGVPSRQVVIFYAAGKERAQRQGLLLRRAHQIRAGRDYMAQAPKG